MAKYIEIEASVGVSFEAELASDKQKIEKEIGDLKYEEKER